MNSEAIKNPVTLESIAGSILLMSESLSKSINSLSARTDAFEIRVIADMVTKNELLILQERVGAVETRLNGITLSVDDLPTRKEFVSLEKRLGEKIDIVEVRLEKQIDDLAISVHNEFERVHIRLDDMDKHLVSFKNNDLKLDKRVKRLEGVMWAGN